LSKTNIADE
jgi:uncharacterized protein YjbJ (UPF0337 family)